MNYTARTLWIAYFELMCRSMLVEIIQKYANLFDFFLNTLHVMHWVINSNILQTYYLNSLMHTVEKAGLVLNSHVRNYMGDSTVTCITLFASFHIPEAVDNMPVRLATSDVAQSVKAYCTCKTSTWW